MAESITQKGPSIRSTERWKISEKEMREGALEEVVEDIMQRKMKDPNITEEDRKNAKALAEVYDMARSGDYSVHISVDKPFAIQKGASGGYYASEGEITVDSKGAKWNETGWKFYHNIEACPVCGGKDLFFNDFPKGMTTACKECPWAEDMGPLREAVLRAILNRNEPPWRKE